MSREPWTLDSKIDWNELEKRAIAGDPEAEFCLGAACIDGLARQDGGLIVERSPEQAVYWFRRAAIRGHAGAQISLGHCLDVGLGVEQNKTEAMRWYKKAYRRGDEVAAVNIAILYEEKGDRRRAFYWYRRAAEMGDPGAAFKVAKCLIHGIGVRKNRRVGCEELRSLVDNLGDHSYGMSGHDFEEAIQLLEECCERTSG